MGRPPWREVLAPSIAAARSGYAVGGAAASYLAITGESVFGWDEHTRPLVRGADGAVVTAGQVVTNPDLADTLEQIGTEGARSLYTGDLAARIAADSDARGGLVTAADLAAYRAVVRTPLRLALGEWDLALNPPPSVGGPMLAVMLRELAAAGWDWSRIIDIQRRVLSYRHQVHDLSTDLEEDGYALLESIDRNGLAGLPTSSSTAHVSAVDSDGTMCAITASSGYGSGATVPGTGLMLNNCLGEPELNRLGLHALAPGTRLASNMAPVGGPVPRRCRRSRSAAPGPTGSPRRSCRCSAGTASKALPMQEAIDAPRVHVRILDDGTPRVDHEDDEAVSAAVRSLGLQSFSHGATSMFFGGVGAASRSADGTLDAAGDPRREAATRVS